MAEKLDKKTFKMTVKEIKDAFTPEGASSYDDLFFIHYFGEAGYTEDKKLSYFDIQDLIKKYFVDEKGNTQRYEKGSQEAQDISKLYHMMENKQNKSEANGNMNEEDVTNTLEGREEAEEEVIASLEETSTTQEAEPENVYGDFIHPLNFLYEHLSKNTNKIDLYKDKNKGELKVEINGEPLKLSENSEEVHHLFKLDIINNKIKKEGYLTDDESKLGANSILSYKKVKINVFDTIFDKPNTQRNTNLEPNEVSKFVITKEKSNQKVDPNTIISSIDAIFENMINNHEVNKNSPFKFNIKQQTKDFLKIAIDYLEIDKKIKEDNGELPLVAYINNFQDLKDQLAALEANTAANTEEENPVSAEDLNQAGEAVEEKVKKTRAEIKAEEELNKIMISSIDKKTSKEVLDAMLEKAKNIKNLTTEENEIDTIDELIIKLQDSVNKIILPVDKNGKIEAINKANEIINALNDIQAHYNVDENNNNR